MTTRLIVGAGFAGLLAGYRAAQAGERVQLIDAAGRPGGALSAVPVGSVVLDAGAEAFSTTGPEMLALVAELGLEDGLVRAAPSRTRVHTEQGSYAMPTGMAGIPADLNSAAVRSLLTPGELAEACHRDSVPWTVPGGANLAELVSDRLGRAILDYFVRPLCKAVYGVDPDQLQARRALGAVLDDATRAGSLCRAIARAGAGAGGQGEPLATLKSGLFCLADRLVGSIRATGGQIDAGVRAERVLRGESGFRIYARSASGARVVYVAPALTLALPPQGALRLFSRADGGVPSALTELGRLVLPRPRAVSWVLFSSRELVRTSVATGIIDVTGVSGVLASTYLSAKWPHLSSVLARHEHVIRFSHRAHRVNAPTPSELRRVIRSHYGAGDVKLVAVVRRNWPSSLYQQRPGGLAAAVRARQALAELGIDLVGGGLSGNGLLGIARMMGPAYQAPSLLNFRRGGHVW